MILLFQSFTFGCPHTQSDTSSASACPPSVSSPPSVLSSSHIPSLSCPFIPSEQTRLLLCSSGPRFPSNLSENFLRRQEVFHVLLSRVSVFSLCGGSACPQLVCAFESTRWICGGSYFRSKWTVISDVSQQPRRSLIQTKTRLLDLRRSVSHVVAGVIKGSVRIDTEAFSYCFSHIETLEPTQRNTAVSISSLPKSYFLWLLFPTDRKPIQPKGNNLSVYFCLAVIEAWRSCSALVLIS